MDGAAMDTEYYRGRPTRGPRCVSGTRRCRTKRRRGVLRWSCSALRPRPRLIAAAVFGVTLLSSDTTTPVEAATTVAPSPAPAAPVLSPAPPAPQAPQVTTVVVQGTAAVLSGAAAAGTRDRISRPVTADDHHADDHRRRRRPRRPPSRRHPRRRRLPRHRRRRRPSTPGPATAEPAPGHPPSTPVRATAEPAPGRPPSTPAQAPEPS